MAWDRIDDELVKPGVYLYQGSLADPVTANQRRGAGWSYHAGQWRPRMNYTTARNRGLL